MLRVFTYFFRALYQSNSDETIEEDCDSMKCACKTGLYDCRMKVYSGFFSGPGDVDNYADLAFGLVVVIVVLNVVIAIVR